MNVSPPKHSGDPLHRVKALQVSGIALLAAIMVVWSGVSFAQTYSYSSVVVEGNKRIGDESVLRFARLQESGVATAADLSAAFQGIASSELFEDVSIVPGGGRILISVTELPIVNVINIEGNRRFTDEILIQAVRSRPQHVYNASQAESDATAIAEVYRAAGRFAAIVTPKIIPRPENRVDLVFEVFEGDVVEVERISFVGNRAFSERRLRSVLESKQAGFLRTFVQGDTFLAERIDFDKTALRDYYFSRGYVDFVINSVAVEMSRERDAFFITFNVTEGRQYRFGKITITSEIPGLKPGIFADLLQIPRREVYTPKLVEEAIMRMEFRASQEGLRFVRVSPEFTRIDENRTLDIDFRLVRGPRVFVERIDIQGNTQTLDSVIRRQFEFVEGDPLNPRKVSEASDRIQALGFFSQVEVNSIPGSSPDQAVVAVNVEERLTGSLTFGFSYATEDGLAGQITLTERNFLGRGQYLSLDLSGGSNNRNYAVTFGEPDFLDRDIDLSLTLGQRNTSGLGQYFDATRFTLGVAAEFPLSERGRLGVNTSFNNYKMGPPSIFSSHQIYRERQRGADTTGVLGYSYSFDTRRSGIGEDSVYFFRVGQELALRESSLGYVRSTGLAAAQTSIFEDAITLSAEFEAGNLSMLQGDSRYHDRFFFHSGIFRGFRRAGIGPRDLAPVNQDALGGMNFAVARLEAQFPLGIAEEVGMRGGLFFDVGTLWELDDTSGGRISGITQSGDLVVFPSAVDDAAKLRSAAGVSLIWDTFLGPLRFNFSRAIQKEDYDLTQDFEFTIATRF
ncbi:MAG: outer membrane protein assembly factor BamA [Albidovulum sp.]|nr:outer membrane protein assembly factor BamA [Albidovulum sp.]MDE0305368.1 outer membrane protein assembly factor BamA [Albidovulum sp.]